MVAIHSSKPTFVVCLAASAGGLGPYMQILGALDCDTDMAFIVAQHRAPTEPELLPSLLSRVTEIPVCDIEQGMKIRGNCIYVMPPRTDVVLSGDVFIVRRTGVRDGWPKTIDGLLQSMALYMGTRTIGVIRSGLDSDGSAALKFVKAAGGITFAQANAEFDSMPINAIETGHIDHKLPARLIAAALNQIAYEQRGSPAA